MMLGSGCGLSCVTTTGLDGRFALADVPEGRYLVVAVQAGAVNSLTHMDMGTLNRVNGAEIDEGLLKPVLNELTLVDVSAAKAANVTVGLGHGASVAGVITYDDGSPAIGVRIHLLRKTQNNSFEEANMFSLGGAATNATLLGYMTDEQGRYRISGLIAGSYALRAEVPVGGIKNLGKNLKGALALGLTGGPKSGMMTSLSAVSGDGLSVYSGNALLKKDLKAFDLSASDQMSGADLQIPLSNLHTVTVHVAAAESGQPLTVVQVQMIEADSKEVMRSGFAEEDGSCTFEYVPEGYYVVRAVSGLVAPDKRIDVGSDNKNLIRYRSAESKIQVSGDIDNVNLQVIRQTEKAAEK
jgi:5-hydroxyisourate hydrolase-like protein (transthyretin family)